MPACRIVIADDEDDLREVLSVLLGCERDVCVVGEAWDGPSVLAAVRTECPDLLLLDLDMPGSVAKQCSMRSRPTVPRYP